MPLGIKVEITWPLDIPFRSKVLKICGMFYWTKNIDAQLFWLSEVHLQCRQLPVWNALPTPSLLHLLLLLTSYGKHLQSSIPWLWLGAPPWAPIAHPVPLGTVFNAGLKSSTHLFAFNPRLYASFLHLLGPAQGWRRADVHGMFIEWMNEWVNETIVN